jgi:flagellar motor switch protein FliN/FliY
MTCTVPDQEKLKRTQAPAASAPEMRGSALNQKLIDNVSVSLEAFIGDARMTVAELVALRTDSVIPLGSSLAQPVELRLNGVSVAKGELVAVEDNFGVRLTEISQ